MSFGKRIPTGQPFLERRGARREQTHAIGEILIPGQPPQRCSILEFSDTGARLQMQSLFGISDTLDLRAFGRIYSARVVRRLPRTLFVDFRLVS
jgi:hypothetical protein